MVGNFRLCAAALVSTAMCGAWAAQAPALRAGVSVEMAATTHASPRPEADGPDAVVVAVTAKGTIYYGITPVSAVELAEKLKAGVPGNKLFVKADARSVYADVAKVLDAARKTGIWTPILLTAQKDKAEPVYPVPPKGLEVRLGPKMPSAGEAAAVQAVDAARDTAALQTAMGGKRTVVLKAEAQLPFGTVVRAIDRCRAAGAQVFLSTE